MLKKYFVIILLLVLIVVGAMGLGMGISLDIHGTMDACSISMKVADDCEKSASEHIHEWQESFRGLIVSEQSIDFSIRMLFDVGFFLSFFILVLLRRDLTVREYFYRKWRSVRLWFCYLMRAMSLGVLEPRLY